MALREVTVEITAKYVTKVIAGDAIEAREKATNLVLLGVVTPCEMDKVILDVQPIKEAVRHD